MKKFVLLIFGLCAVLIGVAATMSPVDSQTRAPSRAPDITTPLPDIPGDMIQVRVFRNGKCHTFAVQAKRMTVQPGDGGPSHETATVAEAAYQRALPPIDPKLHRPPTPAEGEACAQAGPPPGPPGR